MHIRNRLIVTTILTVGLLALPAAPALAKPSSNFGSHVSVCAQTMGFSGSHNPGMHRGAAGWDGEACH